MKFSKNVNNKKHTPKLIFFNEKKIEKDSDNFWHRKLTLKVRNWQFSITWFRAGVDLPKNFFHEKVLFFTQLSYHLMRKLLKKILNAIYFSGIGKLLSGPSDAGGVCPAPSYQYREGGEDFCCCEHSCCWRRCAKSSPPVNCLQEIPNSRWIFNDQLGYYQAFSGT